MKKIAVLFPGIGYTNDKPLLYYSRKLAQSLDYEIIAIQYTAIPARINVHDDSAIEQWIRDGLADVLNQLMSISWHDYDDIVFISKSIGTAVAVNYAYNQHINARHVLLTPLSQTFQQPVSQAIAFHGNQDPWADTQVIEEACMSLNIPLTIFNHANHSLETGHITNDLTILKQVITTMNSYLLF